jgi:transposase-like protein
MQTGVEVSELCRREGINPTMYYGWKRKLLSSSGKVFDDSPGKRQAQEEIAEAELRRWKGVAEGGRGRGLPEPLDGVPHPQGG